MQRNTGYFPTESLEPSGNRLFSRSALNEGDLFRGSLEVHMSADAMTLDEFYELMTDSEATKKITLQNIDAEDPKKEYTNIYADFTYPRSIGKQCVTKVNYATGEPVEEVHLVATLEQLTFVERQLAALGL